MKYYIEVTNAKSVEEILDKYKEGSQTTLSHNWPIEKGSAVFLYFDLKDKPGVYCIANVIESYAVEKDIAITKIEIMRCDNYPFIRKDELKTDTRFWGLHGVGQEEAKEYILMMDRWEPYAENNLLSIEQVAIRINSSIQSINYWYAFKRRNPENEYAKLLPDYYQLNKRQKRYWAKESIKDLLIFKNSIPKGRNGILGDVTQKYLRNREISAEARYINETISSLHKRNVDEETLKNIRDLLITDARERGLSI